jgi:hypothetical protein
VRAEKSGAAGDQCAFWAHAFWPFLISVIFMIKMTLALFSSILYL